MSSPTSRPGDPELARWLARRSVAAYLLPGSVLPKPARCVPHTYTDAELTVLFGQADHCNKRIMTPEGWASGVPAGAAHRNVVPSGWCISSRSARVGRPSQSPSIVTA